MCVPTGCAKEVRGLPTISGVRGIQQDVCWELVARTRSLGCNQFQRFGMAVAAAPSPAGTVPAAAPGPVGELGAAASGSASNANGTAAMSIAIAGIAAFGLVVAGMRARAAEQALERVRVARGGRLSLRFNYRWQVLVIDTLEIAPVSSVRRP